MAWVLGDARQPIILMMMMMTRMKLILPRIDRDIQKSPSKKKTHPISLKYSTTGAATYQPHSTTAATKTAITTTPAATATDNQHPKTNKAEQ